MSSLVQTVIATGTSDTGSPLPQTVHRVISVSDLFLDNSDRQSVAIIGDVHGCLTELKKLISKLEPETTRSGYPLGTIIFVGDLVVKGPFSVETIRYVKDELSSKYKVHAVRGNHEDNCLLAHHKIGPKQYHKKKEFNFVKNFTLDEINWIQALPITILIDSALLIVHAGIIPSSNCEYQQTLFKDLIRMRTVDKANTKKPNKENPSDNNSDKLVLWGSKHIGPPFVVFGHAAKQRLQKHDWAIGLDTGAVYGGQLTALVIQVDKKEKLDLIDIIRNKSVIINVQSDKVYEKPDSED